MSKGDIVNKITAEFASIKKSDASKIHDVFMQTIESNLREHGLIRLHGIGTLHIIKCEEKKCRNPRNGEMITVPEQKRVRFRPSKGLLESVNE